MPNWGLTICNTKIHSVCNTDTDYKSVYSRHSDYKSEWTVNGNGAAMTRDDATPNKVNGNGAAKDATPNKGM